MSDLSRPESNDGADEVAHETPEVVELPAKAADQDAPRNSISEPAKVMRIGSMIKQLLEEVRTTPLDDAGRNRLKDIYETSISELGEALSPDLNDELNSLALPFGEDNVPSDSELRIAQAQLVGWLEGLFHGIQATLFAQQMAARQQLEQMHQQALPTSAASRPPQTGTYL
ncbi:MAG: bacterial proteasome activator family protein [Acidimicrobiales bacterium]|nr:bacterial proteasome activator family protein [Acidimicrobiales bacterium]